MFFLYSLNILMNIPSTLHLFSTVLLNMQRVSFLRGTANISRLGVKAHLRRNLFTMEGHEKGNGDSCSSEWNREQEEVMKLKDFTMDDGCQYFE
jgi:hypothetical protein